MELFVMKFLSLLVWIRRALSVAAIIGGAAVAIDWPTSLVKTRRFVTATAAEPQSGLADEGSIPELGGAVAWLNSAPLSRESLRGKVVLVNFWTYSCINSLRESPYMKGWAAKYRDAGLVVIGVPAPEFGFEREGGNLGASLAYPLTEFEAAPNGDERSPETYVGDRRAEGFASPERFAQDARKTYSPPATPSLNHGD
jgi:thiol-disulfide isomerase/thioredoxin